MASGRANCKAATEPSRATASATPAGPYFKDCVHNIVWVMDTGITGLAVVGHTHDGRRSRCKRHPAEIVTRRLTRHPVITGLLPRPDLEGEIVENEVALPCGDDQNGVVFVVTGTHDGQAEGGGGNALRD